MNKNIFLILSVIFLGCNTKDKSSIIPYDSKKLIEIKLDEELTNTVNTDFLFNEPSFVKLETNDNNLIGYVSQVIMKNNLIIIVDNKVSKLISVFSSDGKFKYNIGKLGQAPSEYISCYHVSLLPNKDIIAVYDDKGAKIHYYKLDGKYLFSKKILFTALQFEFVNLNKIAYVSFGNLNMDNNELVISDSDNNIIQTGFKSLYKENHFSYSVPKQMYKYDNKVFYYHSFNDTIFEICDNDIFARYYLNIMKYKRPQINSNTTNKEMSEYYQKYISFDGEFYEFEKSAIFYVNIPNNTQQPFLLYSKETGKTYKWNMGYNNPYFSYLNIFKPIARSGNNTMVAVVSAQSIVGFKNTLYERLIATNTNKKKADILYDKLKEDDNPILIFYPIDVKE